MQSRFTMSFSSTAVDSSRGNSGMEDMLYTAFESCMDGDMVFRGSCTCTQPTENPFNRSPYSLRTTAAAAVATTAGHVLTSAVTVSELPPRCHAKTRPQRFSRTTSR
jgi:hypothetical protein